MIELQKLIEKGCIFMLTNDNGEIEITITIKPEDALDYLGVNPTESNLDTLSEVLDTEEMDDEVTSYAYRWLEDHIDTNDFED